MVTVLLLCDHCVCDVLPSQNCHPFPQRELDIATDPWGIKVLRVEM